MNHLAVFKKIIIIYACVVCALNLTTASPINSNSDITFRRRSYDDAQQCDNLWWSSSENWKNWKKSELGNSDEKAKNNNEWQKKDQTWENLTKQCRNDKSIKNSKHNCHRSKKIHSRKPFEEKMWSKWQKYSDCRCQSIKWDPKNELGITVCYQVAWYNPHSGRFVGEITAYRWKAKDQKKNISKFSLQFTFPSGGGKVSRHLKINGNGSSSNWYEAPAAKYSWNDQEKDTQKIYISGYLSKNNKEGKLLSYLISPSEYKLVYDGCDGSMLKENYDYQNMWSSSYMPVKPYAPALEGSGNDKCLPPKASVAPPPQMPDDSNSTTSTDMPTGTMPTDMPAGMMPTDTPTGTMPTDTPTGTMPTDMPTSTPTDGSNSATPDSSSGSDQSSGTADGSNSATPDSSSGSSGTTDDSNSGSGTPTSDSNETADSDNGTADSSSNNNVQGSDGSPDSAVAAYSSSSSPMAMKVQLPGTTFGVFPIGLIIFSALTLIGIGCVARTTWERKRYRSQFRRRQEIERQALGRAI